jgi:UDP-glucuronate 4-epimerase
MSSRPEVVRAVVTGCAGFIGFHLSRALLADGIEVIGVDDLNDAYDTRLKDWRLMRLRECAGFHFEHRDITRPADLEAIETSGVEIVYHLAARAGVRQSLAQPLLYVRTNVEGTLNVLAWCHTHGIRRVLVASTSGVYGSHQARPFEEADSTDRPLSPYAASKKAAELIAASYAHLYGLDVPVTRFFTVYGPAGRPELSIFRFVQAVSEGRPVRINGDGSQTRDFTFIDDVVRGIRMVAERVRGFDVVNLGGSDPVNLLHVLALIERETGRKAVIEHASMPPADVMATWASTTKARALGWSPRVRLPDGIHATVEWYRENRAWASQVVTGD